MSVSMAFGTSNPTAYMMVDCAMDMFFMADVGLNFLTGR